MAIINTQSPSGLTIITVYHLLLKHNSIKVEHARFITVLSKYVVEKVLEVLFLSFWQTHCGRVIFYPFEP